MTCIKIMHSCFNLKKGDGLQIDTKLSPNELDKLEQTETDNSISLYFASLTG